MRVVTAYSQQEDNFGYPIRVDGEEAKEPFCEFSLPDKDYEERKFAKRLAPEGSSSPPSLSHQLSSLSVEGGRAVRRYSTVDDTDGE